MAGQPPSQEPSMEDILASIRRIVAEDGPLGDKPPAKSEDEEVLELTELVEEPAAPPVAVLDEGEGDAPAELLSARTQAQAGAALGDLVRTVRREDPAPLGRSPLEALVLEALKPALKTWLDQNLAPLVERVVRDEVRRLTRRVEDS